MSSWNVFFDVALFAVLVIAAVSGLTTFYMVLFKFGALMNLFKHSKAIEVRKRFSGSLWGRWFIVGTMCAMVVFSEKQIQQGALDARDYEGLPKKMVLLFRLLMSSACFSFIALFILIEVGRYLGWVSR